MKIGIIGFPNVGKSSLFQTLTSQEVLIADRPFATIDPNIGQLIIKDKRLETLQTIYNAKKIIYPSIQVVDIAGLIKDSHKGKGLGNKFLSSARETNLLLLVIRHFKDKNNNNELSKISLIDQVKTIYLELLYSDYEIIQKILPKITSQYKKNHESKILKKIKILEKFIQLAEEEEFFIEKQFKFDEIQEIKEYNFFSFKPIYVLTNTDALENNKFSEEISQLLSFLKEHNINSTLINIKFENELKNYSPEELNEIKSWTKDYHEQLNQLVLNIFKISENSIFFTCSEKEVRGWIFKNNSNAKDGAGVIHSDIKQNFIILEKIDFNEISQLFNENKKIDFKRLTKFENKNYLLKDGDICHFRFNKPK